MKHLSFHRKGGFWRLYINGDLQFDERDERLYHEALALLPVALAIQRNPKRPIRVLILGGGDGLALREVLRFPQVAHVCLIDKDPDILRMAQTEWAHLNQHAFDDPRVRVVTADARTALEATASWDVALVDFTYPKDPDSASFLSVAFFQKLRTLLPETGVLALNAVSPEKTAAAFGCLARTLEEAGFHVRPYRIDLPSFREEGYGGWGFLFGAPQAIDDAHIANLSLPWNFSLSRENRQKATAWPLEAMPRTRPNHRDELFAYLTNPVDSTEFLAPRLTVAQGFSNWVKGAEGARTLEELLAALPIGEQHIFRENLIEQRDQMETWLRNTDWNAFVEASLEREREWPERWRAELVKWKDLLSRLTPDMDTILRQSYRVLAVLLLTLVLANLLFPDNLYAKGYSSHYDGSPSYSMSYTSPNWNPSPYRYRYSSGWRRGYGTYNSRLYDSSGKAYDRFLFTKEGQSEIKPMALSASLQLLEDGTIAYATPLKEVAGRLTPDRISLRDRNDLAVQELEMSAALHADVALQIEAQRPLLRKALADHERWLSWVGWARWTGPGREAVTDKDVLTKWSALIDQASIKWTGQKAAAPADPLWISLFPSIYLNTSERSGSPRALILVRPGGEREFRPVPDAPYTAFDRFLFAILRQTAAGRGNNIVWLYLPPEYRRSGQW